MDPNAALDQARKAATDLLAFLDSGRWEPGEEVDHDAIVEENAYSLCEAFMALDGWMETGGFSPWALDNGTRG